MAALPGSGMTIVEAPVASQPIAVHPTPIAAFIGRCAAGPLNTPITVDSYSAFERWFGNAAINTALADQLRLFFKHGGSRAIVIRVANNPSAGLLALPSDAGDFVLRLVNPGSGEYVRASVDYDGIDDERLFNLTLQRINPDGNRILDQEIHPRLSVDPDSGAWYFTALAESALARPESIDQCLSVRPSQTLSDRVGESVCYVGLSKAGTDGNPLTDYDRIGSDVSGDGLFALDLVSHVDFVHATEGPGPAFLIAAERYCAARNALLVVDPPANDDSVAHLMKWRKEMAVDSPHVMHYYPMIQSREGTSTQRMSAAGALIGLLSKQDETRHVFHALADASLQTTAALRREWRPAASVDIDEAEQLMAVGVNPIMRSERDQALFPGLVTAANRKDRALGALPEQRLIKFILRQIERGTRWAVFEPDSPSVHARLQRQVEAFMGALEALGAFATDGTGRAWSVECSKDEQSDVQGVRLLLAFRPLGASQPFMYSMTQSEDGTSVCRTAFRYEHR
ncbi:MAG: hypothetical protein AAAFM81_02115 [Pseudomonadota bacterium]